MAVWGVETGSEGITTTFAGIAINHVPGFGLAQLVGAATARACFSITSGTVQPTK
jgi:hypothetical protein